LASLKVQVSALLGDNDYLDVDHELLMKDKSTCSTLELEMIRRERNRMHAKKTRLRKKKMIQEMEAVRVFSCTCVLSCTHNVLLRTTLDRSSTSSSGR